MNTRPYGEIVRGVDPTEDWRADFVYWTLVELYAAAHDWTGLVEIFEALLAGEISTNEARKAWTDHAHSRQVGA